MSAQVLPHFPFRSSDLELADRAKVLSPSIVALNLAVCDALMLCLPTNGGTPGGSGEDLAATTASTLVPCKAPGGLRLAFDWIGSVVEYLVELFGAVSSSPGTATVLRRCVDPRVYAGVGVEKWGGWGGRFSFCSRMSQGRLLLWR